MSDAMQRITSIASPSSSLLSRARMIMLLPFVIAIMALGLRLYGLDWDQGHLFHPDERSIYMRADCMYLTLTDSPGWQGCANRDFPLDEPGIPSPGTFFDAERSPLNPHWFPLGSVLIYVLVLVRAGLGLFMDSVGLSDLAMVGRTLTALADTASVLLLFALGRRLYGRATGILAAALGAFTVVSIQLAHFYRPEPFIVLLALAGFWFMLNVIQRDRWRDHLWLGVLIGLSFAFKPTSLHLLAPLALTYAVAAWRAWSFYSLMVPVVAFLGVAVRGVIAGSMALSVFAILEPYAFLDFGKFIADLTWETDIARTAGIVPYTVQYVDTPKVWYELRQTSVWALGLPLGLAAWGGLLLTAARVWWRPRLGDLLLLAWVIPVFLTVATFEVKFLRYMAPILPVMVLLGSRWLIAAYQWTAHKSSLLRSVTAGGIALVVVATAFYALAFMGVYSQPHTAVQASQWVNANISLGANILTDNHWDEGFPGLHRYRVTQLPMYERDDVLKFDLLAERLASADYLMVYSNRPFGSIARLPERYPASSRYYQQLFAGGLGYRLERAFASYPSLLGISFAHDPFTRAQVAKPATLPGVSVSLTLDLGYADGNVTNYDHPLVLLFRNEEHLKPSALLRRMAGEQPDVPQTDNEDALTSAALLALFTTIGGSAEIEGLLLSEEAWATQRAGGTWTELFAEQGIAHRMPWLVWLLLVEAIALAALPLSVAVFRWLPDRGVVLARPLGLLLVAWLTWSGASLGWWSFSRQSVLGAVLLLALVSGVLLYSQRTHMASMAKRRWRYLLGVEALFLVAFFVFLAIRAANPDLWHPWRGGEKPMDLAYLTAVVKSTIMPPYDPWYAGGYLNYYYFGQFIMATLIKATGIVPAVAYNLAIPLVFALTVTGAFTLGHNLTESLRQRRYPHLSRGSTLGAGLAVAAMVAVLGNLNGAGQLLIGGWRWLGEGGFPAFDFWQSSRLMPGQISITEFPFWGFLFADLHSHIIAIPFTLLVLGLALNLVLSAGDGLSWPTRAPTAVLLALAVGALAAINTWDIPAYALIALASGAVVVATRDGPLQAGHLVRWLAWTALLWGAAYALFLPFHASYDAPFGGVKASPERTAFWQYAAIHGVMFFLVGSWLVVEVYRRLGGGPLVSPGPGAATAQAIGSSIQRFVSRRTLAASVAVVLATTLALAGWETVGVLLVFLGLATTLAVWWIAHRHHAETPIYLFLLTLVGVAFGIGLGVDVVSLENDIDRMNTVFKLYLNAWVLMAVVAGVSLWHLWASEALQWRGPGHLLVRGWVVVLIMLVVSSAIFPVLGTRARLADRFQVLPLTLDGTAYQQVAIYTDPGPSSISSEADARFPLAADATALKYMRRHINGSPVVLEAVTNQYRWTPRVAKYAGLPVVMGWEWHQSQQRGPDVRQRIRDVNVMYSTVDRRQLERLLERYQVEYIYVGPVERLYYSGAGLRKFDDMVGSRLEVFFQSDPVTVYHVLPRASAQASVPP
jgi:YYY domain-containing protein